MRSVLELDHLIPDSACLWRARGAVRCNDTSRVTTFIGKRTAQATANSLPVRQEKEGGKNIYTHYEHNCKDGRNTHKLAIQAAKDHEKK